MGDVTVGYSLRLPEIFSLNAVEYESFHQAWVKAIRLLPAGTALYKQDWFTEEKYAGDFEQELSFLSGSSERFFHERPYLAQIGRAVQQECRDRSRMPSSA
eukprot:TRINITY_DN34632_c0_g1_i4.p1 TRINITY_DN34632_c0_g1~~TRINITY_DN34632_c0_g1_i4.p1  ORF type:complete len:101 (+),score=26.57 TRINITY_DN34632_c0_g1_i4:508-810(+)